MGGKKGKGKKGKKGKGGGQDAEEEPPVVQGGAESQPENEEGAGAEVPASGASDAEDEKSSDEAAAAAAAETDVPDTPVVPETPAITEPSETAGAAETTEATEPTEAAETETTTTATVEPEAATPKEDAEEDAAADDNNSNANASDSTVEDLSAPENQDDSQPEHAAEPASDEASIESTDTEPISDDEPAPSAAEASAGPPAQEPVEKAQEPAEEAVQAPAERAATPAPQLPESPTEQYIDTASNRSFDQMATTGIPYATTIDAPLSPETVFQEAREHPPSPTPSSGTTKHVDLYPNEKTSRPPSSHRGDQRYGMPPAAPSPPVNAGVMLGRDVYTPPDPPSRQRAAAGQLPDPPPYRGTAGSLPPTHLMGRSLSGSGYFHPNNHHTHTRSALSQPPISSPHYAEHLPHLPRRSTGLVGTPPVNGMMGSPYPPGVATPGMGPGMRQPQYPFSPPGSYQPSPNMSDFFSMSRRQPSMSGGNSGEYSPEQAIADEEQDEEDDNQMVSHINSVIPIISTFLHRQRERQGSLGAREINLREQIAHHEDQARQAENRYQNQLRTTESLREKLDHTLKLHEAESTKLRLQIGNLDEKHREIHERVVEIREAKSFVQAQKDALEKDLAALKLEIEAQKASYAELETARAALEAEKADLESRLDGTEKEKVAAEEAADKARQDAEDFKVEKQTEFDGWKADAEKTFQEDKQLLAEEFTRRLTVKDDELDGVKKTLVDTTKDLDEHKEAKADLESQVAALKTAQDEAAQREEDLKKELETVQTDLADTRKQLEDVKTELDETKKQLEETKTELDETKKLLDDTKAELEQTKTTLEETKATLEATQATLEETKTALEETKISLEQRTTELAETQAGWDGTKTELEETKQAAADSNKDWQDKHEALVQELEGARAANVMALDALRTEHKRQLDETASDHESKIAGLQADHARQLDEERADHSKQKDEAAAAFAELQANLLKEMEEEKEKNAKEKEALQEEFNNTKDSLEKIISELKNVTDTLGAEKGRLQKVLECFGDVTELKSKGDAYYRDAFAQLSKQIFDVANTHFNRMPLAPVPDEILSSLPSGFPLFTAASIPSRNLRAAYVAHTISRILTTRIFNPFLFSLSRNNAKANALLGSISQHLREKNTRKESAWRQQTLMAAFTMNGAKQNINTVAATVVEEIMEELEWFAEMSGREDLEVAVRRVVKLAAETWRFARLERELIVAEMPDLEAVSSHLESWMAFDFTSAHADAGSVCSLNFTDGLTATAEQQTSAAAADDRRLLLRLFPVVRREPIHDDLRYQAEDKNDRGFVYSRGFALYDDAQSVRARRQELDLESPSHAANGTYTRSLTPPGQDTPPDSHEYISLPRTTHMHQQPPHRQSSKAATTNGVRSTRPPSPPVSEGRGSSPPSPLPSPLFPSSQVLPSFEERSPGGHQQRSTSRASVDEDTVRNNASDEDVFPKERASADADGLLHPSNHSAEDSGSPRRARPGSMRSVTSESSRNSKFYVNSHQAAIKGLYGNTARIKHAFLERANSTGSASSARA